MTRLDAVIKDIEAVNKMGNAWIYDADGNKVEASREDVLVFAYYLRCEGIPASAVEIVHALGDQAILAIHDLHLPEMEVRLTEHFICHMSGVDESELAC